jgi:hypothetical protein
MSIYFTDEQFKEVIPSCSTWTEVADKLNIPKFATQRIHAGWNRDFRLLAYRLNIDTSHMTGINNHRKKARRRIPDSEVFSYGSGFRGAALKKRLLKGGMPEICSQCGIDEWKNKKLSIQVDHIDGDSMNNIRSNLRFLCPNCHTQTFSHSRKTKSSVIHSVKITATLDI